MLEGSGWTEALIEVQVASSGVAESFLKTSHLTRTRHGHQVSLLALHNFQREAFMLCEGPKDEKSQQLWRKDMVQKSPTFAYWDLILRFETLILLFVRAHRVELFIIRATFGGTNTTVLCLGSCQLCKMDASPHQRYEVLACFCKRRIREQLSLGDFQDNEQFFRNPF